MTPRNLFSAGTAGIVAGLAVWGTFTLKQQREDAEDGRRLLSIFSSQDDRQEAQLSAEGRALVQLFRSSGYARAAFLDAGLTDASAVRRLKGREQGLAVSLSRVESSEAQFLFRRSI